METEQSENKKSCCKVRYVVSLLAFLSLANLFSICINLSIAMVAMVKTPMEDEESNNTVICPQLVGKYRVADDGDDPFGIPPEGEFDWNSTLQGTLLSAFFYGYFLSSVSAGVVATTYGAKWVLGGGVLVAGLFTLFLPLATRWSPWALFAVRLVIGVGSGVCLPTIHTLIGKWIPAQERSIQNTLIYNGITAGNVLTLTLSGHLIKSGFLGGWPSVFYITGALACTWFVFWAAFVYESPFDHPLISEDELKEITGGLKPKHKKGSIPWKAIATSVPFMALCVTHFCNNWGFSTLLTYVPTYLSQVLHVDISENGLLSAIPYIASFVFASFSCVVVDKVRSRGLLQITTLRKLANSIAFFLPGLCLIIIPFLGCAPIPIIALLALTSGFNGFKLSGFCVTHVDMSPQYAGLLMSGTSTFGNFAGVLAPLYAGSIQKEYPTMDGWRTIFITAGVIYITGGVIYDFFGSANQQPWGADSESQAQNQEDAVPVADTDKNDSSEETVRTNNSEANKNSEAKISDEYSETSNSDSETESAGSRTDIEDSEKKLENTETNDQTSNR